MQYFAWDAYIAKKVILIHIISIIYFHYTIHHKSQCSSYIIPPSPLKTTKKRHPRDDKTRPIPTSEALNPNISPPQWDGT